MSTPPQLRRISKEDYPSEQRVLIEKLSFILNTFMEQTNNVLTKNVDFTNLNQELKDITVEVDSGGIPTMITSLKHSLKTRLSGILCIFAQNSDTFPSSGIFITFEENNKIVKINHITGLPAGNSFKLRLLLIGQ